MRLPPRVAGLAGYCAAGRRRGRSPSTTSPATLGFAGVTSRSASATSLARCWLRPVAARPTRVLGVLSVLDRTQPAGCRGARPLAGRFGPRVLKGALTLAGPPWNPGRSAPWEADAGRHGCSTTSSRTQTSRSRRRVAPRSEHRRLHRLVRTRFRTERPRGPAPSLALPGLITPEWGLRRRGLGAGNQGRSHRLGASTRTTRAIGSVAGGVIVELDPDGEETDTGVVEQEQRRPLRPRHTACAGIIKAARAPASRSTPRAFSARKLTGRARCFAGALDWGGSSPACK